MNERGRGEEGGSVSVRVGSTVLSCVCVCEQRCVSYNEQSWQLHVDATVQTLPSDLAPCLQLIAWFGDLQWLPSCDPAEPCVLL